MEIRIGMQNVTRELVLEVDQSAEELTKTVSAALNSKEQLVLTDKKGKTIVVSGAAIAYVEFGDVDARQVGFVR
ncbi:MAG TPA: DUF3107 domain-containing protein [Actinomyces sp.]|nr:DUF3107 domain-containing protein [Actinomyces sp.]